MDVRFRRRLTVFPAEFFEARTDHRKSSAAPDAERAGYWLWRGPSFLTAGSRRNAPGIGAEVITAAQPYADEINAIGAAAQQQAAAQDATAGAAVAALLGAAIDGAVDAASAELERLWGAVL
jgi:hypothetical protein